MHLTSKITCFTYFKIYFKLLIILDNAKNDCVQNVETFVKLYFKAYTNILYVEV